MTKQGIKIFFCVCVGLLTLIPANIYKRVKPTIDAWVANSWRAVER